jgi:ABC-type uncharacterized transport system auxiliary subunit
MSDIKLKNDLKHLSKLSNKKNSEVMINSIVNIIQMQNKEVKEEQVYRVARSLLS